MRRFSLYGVVIVATMAGSMVPRTGLLAQTNAEAKSVVVAVLDDYPAFSPTSASPGQARRELRAIVFRQDPTDATRSVIIVNPAHVTPETIYTALRALNTSRGSNGGSNLIVITSHDNGASDAGTAATLAALRPFIATLLAREPSHLSGHPGLGRFTVITEALLTDVVTPTK